MAGMPLLAPQLPLTVPKKELLITRELSELRYDIQQKVMQLRNDIIGSGHSPY